MKLAILLVPCLLAACAGAPTREVLVLDEEGRPVAGAQVRLSTGAPWRPEVVAAVTTDASGRARVPADLPSAPRLAAWSDFPPRRHVAFGDFDPARAAWVAGADPCAIPVQELWIGALEAPAGERLVHLRQITWSGFAPADETDGLPRPWRAAHPRARWVDGYLNPSQEAEPVEVLVEVFGKRPVVLPLALERASTWRAPAPIEAAALPDWPWAEVTFALQQPDGTPLDPSVAATLLEGAVLIRRQPLAHHERYWLRDRTGPGLALPCGAYDLELDWLRSEPRAVPVEVREDSAQLEVRLPVQLAALTLDLEDIGRDGASLSARAGEVETHRNVPISDRRQQTLDMIVPAGPVELVIEFVDEAAFHRDTLELEVRPGPARRVNWRVRRAGS